MYEFNCLGETAMAIPNGAFGQGAYWDRENDQAVQKKIG